MLIYFVNLFMNSNVNYLIRTIATDISCFLLAAEY